MTTVSGDVFQKFDKVTVPMKTSCVHSHVPNNFPCSPHVFFIVYMVFFVSKRSPALRSFPPRRSRLWYRFLDLWPGPNSMFFGTSNSRRVWKTEGFNRTRGFFLWFRDFGWRRSGISETGDCEDMYIMYQYIIILHKSNVGQNITSSSKTVAWVSQASYL